MEFRRVDVIIAELGAAPAAPAKVIIDWELVGQNAGIEKISFQLERSLSEAFPEDDVTVLDTVAGVSKILSYAYYDPAPNLISMWRRYFYRIRATTPDGEVLSSVRTWETAPRPFQLAIIEGHDWHLRYNVGQPSFAFIERTADGPRCPNCYSAATGRPTRSDCPICLGTTRQRPFMGPITFFVDYNPDPKITQITTFGETEPKNTTCWFSAFPRLKPGDVIYQVGPATLWRIGRLNPVKPDGTTIQQIASLSALDYTSIEYTRILSLITPDVLRATVKEWERIKQERMF